MVINNKQLYTSMIVVLVWSCTVNAMDDLPLELQCRLCCEDIKNQVTLASYCDVVMRVRQVCKRWNAFLHPSSYDHLQAYSGKHCSIGMKGNLIRQACQRKRYDRARLLFALLMPEDDIHIPIKLAISKFNTSLANYVETKYARRMGLHTRVLLHYLTGNNNTIITRYPLTCNPSAFEKEGKLIKIALRAGHTHLAQRLLAHLYILGAGTSKSSPFLPDMVRAAIRWNDKKMLDDTLWCMKDTHASEIPVVNKVWSALELARQGALCTDDQQAQMREKLCQLIEKGDHKQRRLITYVLAKQNQDLPFIWCVDTWRQAGHTVDYIKLCAQAASMGKQVVKCVVDRYNIALENQDLQGTFKVAMSRGDAPLLAYLCKQLWSPKALWLTAAAHHGYYSIVKNYREGSQEDDDLFSLACHNGHQEIADYIAMSNRHTRYDSVLRKAVKSSDMFAVLCVLKAKQNYASPLYEVINLIWRRNDQARNNRDMLQLMRLIVQHDIDICWELMSQYDYVQKYRKPYEQMRAQKERSKKENEE